MNRYILYVREGCEYCNRVLAAGEKLGIEFALRDIADPATCDDLIERGGKQQVPYLVDVEEAVEMYESDDIINYIESNA